MRALILRVFKHFHSADKIEHAGYLVCLIIAEHTVLRVLAIVLFCGVIIVAIRYER